MLRPRTIRLMTITTVFAVVLSLPGIALADTDTTAPTLDEIADVVDSDDFEAAQQRALKAVNKRIRVVRELVQEVRTARHVAEAHQEALLEQLARVLNNLVQIKGAIRVADTPAELAEAVRAMLGLHVFVLFVPKVAEVLLADHLVWKAHKHVGIAEELGDAIARAEEAGHDVTELWNALERMERLIKRGAKAAAPVPGMVIPLGPEDWPDPAKYVLRRGAHRLDNSAHYLRRAHRVGKYIAHELRNLKDEALAAA